MTARDKFLQVCFNCGYVLCGTCGAVGTAGVVHPSCLDIKHIGDCDMRELNQTLGCDQCTEPEVETERCKGFCPVCGPHYA